MSKPPLLLHDRRERRISHALTDGTLRYYSHSPLESFTGLMDVTQFIHRHSCENL